MQTTLVSDSDGELDITLHGFRRFDGVLEHERNVVVIVQVENSIEVWESDCYNGDFRDDTATTRRLMDWYTDTGHAPEHIGNVIKFNRRGSDTLFWR